MTGDIYAVDSVRKRYISKLGSNLVNMLINLVIQAIVPRALGPKLYGDYSFLTNSFAQIISFFDLGTSSAYYTKLSHRPNDAGLVSFYWYFSLVVCVMLVILVVSLSAFSLEEYLWPGQAIEYVYIAALWGILTWIGQVLTKMADAYGLTVKTERMRIFQRILNLLLIVILFLCHKLDLINYFVVNYLVFAFLIISFALIIKNSRFNLLGQRIINSDALKGYFREFYEYCGPLVSFALVSLIAVYFDRWFLQVSAGSEEQGFFGLSYQIAAACFLFTGAMTPLLTRELSIAHANNDLELMRSYFRRYVPLFYSIAAYFACFIAVQASLVVSVFGGAAYTEAIPAVMIMALYPVHQTYGQLSGAVFLAAGHTKLYRNIGVSISAVGIIATYFLIAPREQWGLGLGASGLALKMVVVQVIAVNIQLFFNARYLKMAYYRYIGHQIINMIGMLVIAVVTCTICSSVLSASIHPYGVFIISGIVYSLAVFLVVYLYPRFIGLQDNALNELLVIAGRGK